MAMIIAVDFDGILCENQFPNIGPPNYAMVSFVRELIDKGHEVILWTSRVERQLEEAVTWCKDRGLHFCAVNDSAPSNKEQFSAVYASLPTKVYADIYIDDHNPMFVRITEVGGADYALRMTIEDVRRILRWKEEN